MRTAPPVTERLSFIHRHLIAVVFWIILPTTLLSLLLLSLDQPYSWLFFAMSTIFNFFSLYQSDQVGLINRLHAPRLKESFRPFNLAQTVVIVLLVMTQCTMGAYYLLLKSQFSL